MKCLEEASVAAIGQVQCKSLLELLLTPIDRINCIVVKDLKVEGYFS